MCPIESSDEAIAITPYLETRPYVGFIATVFVKDAGFRKDPPVSVPVANTTILDATEAAVPLEDPPATLLVSHGFFVTPKSLFSPVAPCANASQFNFPNIIAPAFLN